LLTGLQKGSNDFIEPSLSQNSINWSVELIGHKYIYIYIYIYFVMFYQSFQNIICSVLLKDAIFF
ncbi:MAG: hypothetical protein N7Q72_03405, partial [Spiroplasma sp. Tabriz.8]|nr:hypothetical protein [Spiroplasma sp. Tabriz.8]